MRDFTQDNQYAKAHEKALAEIRAVLLAELDQLRKSQEEMVVAMNDMRRELMQQSRLLAASA